MVVGLLFDWFVDYSVFFVDFDDEAFSFCYFEFFSDSFWDYYCEAVRLACLVCGDYFHYCFLQFCSRSISILFYRYRKCYKYLYLEIDMVSYRYRRRISNVV